MRVKRPALVGLAPITTIVGLGCWYLSETFIEIPERPSSWGGYRQLPDSQYIDAALKFTTLMETFEPEQADKNFSRARRYLFPGSPSVDQHREESKLRLEEIRTKQLSQTFQVDLRAVKVERYPEEDRVVVKLPGQVDNGHGATSAFMKVELTTIPRNVANEYGIVVTKYAWHPQSDRSASPSS